MMTPSAERAHRATDTPQPTGQRSRLTAERARRWANTWILASVLATPLPLTIAIVWAAVTRQVWFVTTLFLAYSIACVGTLAMVRHVERIQAERKLRHTTPDLSRYRNIRIVYRAPGGESIGPES